ncbi:MAG: 2-oxoacid:acceptor oxidoreductase family protein [Tissierellia bacterium]|nr:2-oxoacid:acceptor oxidoreductase family protein [Tissierellia bacterium]
MRYEIRIAGTGGQGAVLASILLAEAAFQEDKYVAQSQSYGAQQRGGTTKSEVIIDTTPITYAKIQSPNLVLVMAQPALNKFADDVEDDTILLVDEDVDPKNRDGAIAYPIRKTAEEELKNPQAANIISLALINEHLQLVDNDTLDEAIQDHFSHRHWEENREALAAGRRLYGEKHERELLTC